LGAWRRIGANGGIELAQRFGVLTLTHGAERSHQMQFGAVAGRRGGAGIGKCLAHRFGATAQVACARELPDSSEVVNQGAGRLHGGILARSGVGGAAVSTEICEFR